MNSVTPSKTGEKKYPSPYERLKKKNDYLLRQLKDKEAKIHDLRKQLSSARKTMTARTMSRGRNKMNTKGMDLFKTSNKIVVTQYYNFTIFPHLKWLHSS